MVLVFMVKHFQERHSTLSSSKEDVNYLLTAKDRSCSISCYGDLFNKPGRTSERIVNESCWGNINSYQCSQGILSFLLFDHHEQK